MKDFRNLKAWQKAHSLVIDVYKTTASFPKEEMYGLTSQMRRACVSIPANIADGCGRDGEAEFRRFLQIAFGSASELEYYFILSNELKFLKSEDHKILMNQIDEVKSIIMGLIKKLKADQENV